jgi:hypothetical protein
MHTLNLSASDRDSSESFQESFQVQDESEIEAAVETFEENIPFRKWNFGWDADEEIWDMASEILD